MTEKLRHTPLHDAHVRAGAKLVEFAGWRMPVQYSGLIEEHRAVRAAAGLFDVSHMGEVRVAGEGAEGFLQRMTPNDVAKLRPGRAHYSALLTAEGTYVDDLLVYNLGDGEYLLVVNAANAAGDYRWLAEHAGSAAGVEVEDVSDEYALLALQGPSAPQVLRGLTDVALAEVKRYGFARGRVDGAEAIVSRTGYTGEDGFEIYAAPRDAEGIWEALLEAGRPAGLVPAGLGARDTLRLEAAMALYGHEIDRTTTPFEAGLDWTVKLEKGDFVGREALVARREAGLERRLVGFEVTGRGIARHDHEVVADGEAVGRVTSGTWSPTFEKALGMAYVPVALAATGTRLEIRWKQRSLEARVVDLPFYRKG